MILGPYPYVITPIIAKVIIVRVEKIILGSISKEPFGFLHGK